MVIVTVQLYIVTAEVLTEGKPCLSGFCILPGCFQHHKLSHLLAIFCMAQQQAHGHGLYPNRQTHMTLCQSTTFGSDLLYLLKLCHMIGIVIFASGRICGTLAFHIRKSKVSLMRSR